MMTSRFLDANTAKQAHIRTLYVVMVFLMMINIGLWYGWKESPQYIRISIPPDLRAGAIVRPDIGGKRMAWLIFENGWMSYKPI